MIERVRALYRAKPFQPFTFHLADGQTFTVTQPEFIALSPTNQEVFVLDPDGSHHFINLSLVTELKSKKANSAS